MVLGFLNLMPFDALLMLCKYLIKFDAQLPKKSTLVILFKYNTYSVELQTESNRIARVRRYTGIEQYTYTLANTYNKNICGFLINFSYQNVIRSNQRKSGIEKLKNLGSACFNY